jgi:hypothetical protein
MADDLTRLAYTIKLSRKTPGIISFGFPGHENAPHFFHYGRHLS